MTKENDRMSVQTTNGPPLETQLSTLEIDDSPSTGSSQELLKANAKDQARVLSLTQYDSLVDYPMDPGNWDNM